MMGVSLLQIFGDRKFQRVWAASDWAYEVTGVKIVKSVVGDEEHLRLLVPISSHMHCLNLGKRVKGESIRLICGVNFFGGTHQERAELEQRWLLCTSCSRKDFVLERLQRQKGEKALTCSQRQYFVPPCLLSPASTCL